MPSKTPLYQGAQENQGTRTGAQENHPQETRGEGSTSGKLDIDLGSLIRESSSVAGR
jgi:hypothetical protein